MLVPTREIRAHEPAPEPLNHPAEAHGTLQGGLCQNKGKKCGRYGGGQVKIPAAVAHNYLRSEGPKKLLNCLASLRRDIRAVF